MPEGTRIGALVALLERRDDLDRLTVELRSAHVDRVPVRPGVDESISAWYGGIVSLKIEWALDLLITTVETRDTGLDNVAGSCDIVAIDRALDPARSSRLVQSPSFRHHGPLNAQKDDVRVFDDGSPDYLAYFKVEDGQVRDRVHLSYGTYPERIFDLGIGIDEYVSLGLQAAFFADWQLALLAIRKRSTENILHYLPALFPELQGEDFLRRLTARGLTDDAYARR
jgi:hypothetical protein